MIDNIQNVGPDQARRVYGGLRLPRFKEGMGKPSIFSAADVNRLVDVFNSFTALSIVEGSEPAVIITDSNVVIQRPRPNKDLAAVTTNVGKLLLYIDGALAISLDDSLAQSACDTGMLQMTDHSSVSDVELYTIDEFGLCLNHALTSSEVTAAYNSGSGQTWPAISGSVPSLSYYWTLNEVGSGSTKLDSIASLTWDSASVGTPAVPALFSNGVEIFSSGAGAGLRGPNHSPELGYPGTGDGMSLFFWLKVNANATSATTQTDWFLSQFDSVGSQFDILSLNFISKNGTIAIEHDTNSGTVSGFTSFAPTTGTWHFIAAVWKK